VEKRLLFNGVNVQGAGFSIDESIVSAAAILPDPAIASFLITQLAFPGAEQAVDFPVRELLIIPSLNLGKVHPLRERRDFFEQRGQAGAEKKARSCCLFEKLPPVHRSLPLLEKRTYREN
jgi:hypothetical protein